MLPQTKSSKRKQQHIQGQAQEALQTWVYNSVGRWRWATNMYLMSNEHVYFHVASPFCKGCQLVILAALPARTCDIQHGHMFIQSSVAARDLGLHATFLVALL